MAGRLDTNSNIVITGQLTKNVANTTHMEIQDGEIAARFQFRRDGALVYDKEFSADAIWQVPIGLLQSQQEALTQYDNLYQSLIAKLIADLDSSGVCTEK